jgi:hypothetical protein
VRGRTESVRGVLVVADEDAVAITVEAERYAAAAQQAAEQAEIAASVFGEEELGDGDFAGGIVEEAQQSELGTTIFEPSVEAAVEQQHLAFASAPGSALAVSGSAAFTGRAEASGTQQTAESLAAEREAFDLTKFLAKVVIVEAGVARTGQMQDASAHAVRQAARAGPPATGVSQSRLTALPIARFEALDMPRR